MAHDLMQDALSSSGSQVERFRRPGIVVGVGERERVESQQEVRRPAIPPHLPVKP